MSEEKLDWNNAKSHLQGIRQMYTSIGMSGLPALQAVINPLFVRFEKGERTDDLHKEIMGLE